ncbi:MAG: NUDIX hydrolase [Alphaproteobacteria bacterium]|nr:NUDIX hydrolase [Alphaproteobacteria bacterium]
MADGISDRPAGEAAELMAASAAPARTQYGALCWRMHRGKVEVLLITSRDTGRWVIPKGWPIAGLSPFETAAREAWEEAGVEGDVADQDLGVFDYEKSLGHKGSVTCSVQVFGLRVAELKGKFPERKERRRKWFDFEKAARKVPEPELRALLLALPNRLSVA